MRIFLHICCGPCATYVVKHLRESDHALTGYFFNPNIHPCEEYERRLQGAETFCHSVGLALCLDRSGDRESWQDAVLQEPAKRCYLCYGLRLSKVAELAAREGYDAFSTTLLISPFQQHEEIKRAGDEAALRFGVAFHYADWRSHFKLTYRLARERALYRQKYCGCFLSERERVADKGIAALVQGSSKQLPVQS